MSKVILVTGPARSGKSEWAETLATMSKRTVVYIATATQNPGDEEWYKRILKHQKRRPQDWVTLEVPVGLSAALANAKPNNCLLIDSLGTWVANLLSENDKAWENTVQEFLDTVEMIACEMIFVAEETGWGVIPAYPIGRTFRDRLGDLTRQLGRISQDVYLVTGGHVINLSILGYPLPARKRGE